MGLVSVLAGCATLAWYGQAVSGQLDLLSRREHIADLIENPATDDILRQRLERVLEIRQFARSELGLPDSRSFRHYADLQRPAAVWNVIASPRFSVTPKTWCYPIAGCVAYRGYFDRDQAWAAAERLAEEGLDVTVAPAVAYSTLGWFSDPVLNTMLAWSDATLAGFLFHELSHEMLYVPGDSAFNEAYASLVEREGVKRWLARQNEPDLAARWEQDRVIRDRLIEQLLTTRERLSELYAGELNSFDMDVAKTREFLRLQEAIGELADEHETDQLAGWLSRPLNNADLALVATYEAGVGAFADLLAECDSDWTCFHQRSSSVAASGAVARQDFLQAEGRQ